MSVLFQTSCRTACLLVAASGLCGQQSDFENFRVEGTASIWLVNTSGTIRSGIIPVDLEADLNLEQRKPQFTGKLVVKPGRRHRLFVEGTPYRLSGENLISRQFTFAGRTFTFSDQIASRAEIDSISGGYQYDVLSRPGGHLGLQAGIGYVNSTGTVLSRTRGVSATESQSFPFPLPGVEFRSWVIPNSPLLSVSGEVKGISLGSYGYYFQSEFHAGVGLGRHVTLQAGYRFVQADVHRRDEIRGFNPRFAGPIFSLQLRD